MPCQFFGEQLVDDCCLLFVRVCGGLNFCGIKMYGMEERRVELLVFIKVVNSLFGFRDSDNSVII